MIILQINGNRSRATHDLTSATARNNGAGIVVISEPNNSLRMICFPNKEIGELAETLNQIGVLVRARCEQAIIVREFNAKLQAKRILVNAQPYLINNRHHN